MSTTSDEQNEESPARVPEETCLIELYLDSGPVTIPARALTGIAFRLMQVEEVTLSYTRKLNTDNYSSEDFFESHKVNLAGFWNMIPSETLLDPDSSKIVVKAFQEALLQKLGALRIASYRNILACVNERAQELKLPWAKHIAQEVEHLRAEALIRGQGFDPHDVLRSRLRQKVSSEEKKE